CGPRVFSDRPPFCAPCHAAANANVNVNTKRRLAKHLLTKLPCRRRLGLFRSSVIYSGGRPRHRGRQDHAKRHKENDRAKYDCPNLQAWGGQSLITRRLLAIEDNW